jgi:hypothetical protein
MFINEFNDSKENIITSSLKYINFCLQYINDFDNSLIFYDKVSLILIITYSNNIIKKIFNNNSYINIFNPIENNIKILNKNTKISENQKYDLLIYLENKLHDEIINNTEVELNEISLIHTFDFTLLKYINYQFIFENINDKLNKLLKLTDNYDFYTTIKDIIYLVNINKNYNKQIFNINPINTINKVNETNKTDKLKSKK